MKISRKVAKDMLVRFDEFLAMMDVEELIRDGVDLVKFRYCKHGVDVTTVFTPDEIREAKEGGN